MPEQEVRLLTVVQSANFLGISRSQIYNIIKRGELRCVKIENSTRVDRVDLNAFIEEKKKTS